MVKITTLIENHENVDMGLAGEHGLSLLLDNGSECILFDTGQTGMFIDNAKKMNIDLSNVKTVILSHGHYDHTGGLKRIVENFCIDRIFTGRGAMVKKYCYDKETLSKLRYNGNPFDEQFVSDNAALFKTIKRRETKVNDEIYIYTNFKVYNDYEKLNPRFVISDEMDLNKFRTDRFTDEIALGIKTSKGIVICIGCSHVGVINIVKSIEEYSGMKVRGIIGGTHLIDASQKRINDTIRELENMNLEFLAVSHCTGENNIELLKETFGDKFLLNITGKKLVID